MFLKKRDIELRKTQQLRIIMATINNKISTKESIWSVRSIIQQIKSCTGISVSIKNVIKIMKERYRLGYRKIKRVSLAGNSEQNRVLRSLYAQKMLEIYSSNKHVVNIDESWIAESDYRRCRWATKGEDNSLAERAVGHRVNMIVAVSSQGHVWLALTQCNTDENVMQMFLSKLAQAFTA